MKFLNSITTLMICLVSINSIAQINLVGKWSMDWTQCQTTMSTTEKQKFDNMPDATRSNIANSFSSRIFNFKKDQTVEIKWDAKSGPRVENGNWQLDGSVLTITVNNVPRDYTVELYKKTLTLTILSKPETALISKLILTR